MEHKSVYSDLVVRRFVLHHVPECRRKMAGLTAGALEFLTFLYAWQSTDDLYRYQILVVHVGHQFSVVSV